jgi:hypothetical protein
MCSLPNMTKSDLAELSQCRKKKLKKTNSKKTYVKIDEWAALEWTCVDSPTNMAGE